MSVVLADRGGNDLMATSLYCEMVDNFFDCINVRSVNEEVRKRKPFLAPYNSINDIRFDWLLNVFLPYFDSWKK